MSTLAHEQIRDAWEASGLSLDQLREKAGVACSADSLSRKLRGKQPMSTFEAAALAKALDRQVVVVEAQNEAA